jgi:membrane protease YdiL (CAAX protease family)
MALIVTAVVVLIPVELGILFYQGKRLNGKFSLKGVVLYRQKLPWKQYLLWVPIIFVASGVIMTLMASFNTFFEDWFKWIPESMRLGMGLSADFERGKLIQTYILHFIFIIFVAPSVEEVYFRGFLLPRMPDQLKWGKPIVHSFLFALYHVWSPGLFLARTLALLPLILVVQWKKNLYLGMIAHWMINSIDFFIGLVFILGMGV